MMHGYAALAAAIATLFGCVAESTPIHPCAALDAALAESSFVLVTSPASGQRVSSPLRLAGCSRTFESNVVWELRGRDGRLVSSGHMTGGGVDGPAGFETTVDFEVSETEVGRLEVFEEDASDGEGFPPPRTVLPIVLAPDAR